MIEGYSLLTLNSIVDLASGEGSSIVTGAISPTASVDDCLFSIRRSHWCFLKTISSMTTQLDSLSMAVDESDGRSTTSKFPRTRPSELNCKKGESGQEISLVANYIKILAAPKCQCLLLVLDSYVDWIFPGDLYRYHCTFEPEVRSTTKSHWELIMDRFTLKLRLNYGKFVEKRYPRLASKMWLSMERCSIPSKTSEWYLSIHMMCDFSIVFSCSIQG